LASLHSRRTTALAALVLAVLAVAMFAPSLFSSEGLTPMGGDAVEHGRFMQDFSFTQIRQGNLPLWNPHQFCGMPWLGNPNTTMLYPPNWLHLFMSAARAVTLFTVLHVFLLGLFMYLWAARQKLAPLACLFSAVMLSYCGAYFARIHAGHGSPMAAMTWTPLLFLVIDRLLDRPGGLGWILLGIWAAVMMILGGHTQYVLLTVLAVVIYGGVRLVKAAQRGRVLLAVGAIVAASLAISALHILLVVEASSEGARSGTPEYKFISTFSFPPSGFIMYLAPGFFGGLRTSPGSSEMFSYWGDWFYWEITPFIGIAGLALAAYGALYGRRDRRLLCLCLCLVFLVLALGRFTPIHWLLYEYVPPFNRFRCSSRALFYVSMFASLLAGMGLDALLTRRHFSRAVFITLLALAAAAGITGAWAWLSSADGAGNGSWQGFMQWVCTTKGFAWPVSKWSEGEFGRLAGDYAANGVFIAAGTLVAVGVCLLLARKSARWTCVLAVLGMAEMLAFAHMASMHQPLDPYPKLIQQFRAIYRKYLGDYRVENRVMVNSAMSLGASDIWGYDPLVPKRYSEYMNFTQEKRSGAADTFYILWKGHNSFPMLRLKYTIVRQDDGSSLVSGPGELPKPLPHLLLVKDYQVLTSRDAIFAQLSSPSWDYWHNVILESEPDPKPVATDGNGSARIVESSTDWMVIEADLPASAILLVTDSYSRFWRIVPLDKSPRQSYQVLPANYVLRAIPLTAGRHRFRLEYAPPLFPVGKWISIVSVAAYLAAITWAVVRRRKAT
jgi:hypothetical protein